uniref:Uncharacterized protein n=1 Tax=Triticum urartu TaxID=4572 RepID=A0A8R7Q1R0_TRIUA
MQHARHVHGKLQNLRAHVRHRSQTSAGRRAVPVRRASHPLLLPPVRRSRPLLLLFLSVAVRCGSAIGPTLKATREGETRQSGRREWRRG